MLDRFANRRKRQKNERQRAFRARQARGEFVAPVLIDQAILGFLVRNRWLAERDSNEPKRVAEAVRSLLELSAKI
jgi:hypothetical protein